MTDSSEAHPTETIPVAIDHQLYVQPLYIVLDEDGFPRASRFPFLNIGKCPRLYTNNI